MGGAENDFTVGLFDRFDAGTAYAVTFDVMANEIMDRVDMDVGAIDRSDQPGLVVDHHDPAYSVV